MRSGIRRKDVDTLTARMAQIVRAFGFIRCAPIAQANGQKRVYFAAKRAPVQSLGLYFHASGDCGDLFGRFDGFRSCRCARRSGSWVKPLANATTYKDVPASGVLSDATLSYRGTVRIPRTSGGFRRIAVQEK